jgi:nucleoside diphosphate kinase
MCWVTCYNAYAGKDAGLKMVTAHHVTDSAECQDGTLRGAYSLLSGDNVSTIVINMNSAPKRIATVKLS